MIIEISTFWIICSVYVSGIFIAFIMQKTVFRKIIGSDKGDDDSFAVFALFSWLAILINSMFALNSWYDKRQRNKKNK